MILFNIFCFIIHWRKQRAEKINVEIFSKMTPNKIQDDEEKRKHSLNKWSKI